MRGAPQGAVYGGGDAPPARPEEGRGGAGAPESRGWGAGAPCWSLPRPWARRDVAPDLHRVFCQPLTWWGVGVGVPPAGQARARAAGPCLSFGPLAAPAAAPPPHGAPTRGRSLPLPGLWCAACGRAGASAPRRPQVLALQPPARPRTQNNGRRSGRRRRRRPQAGLPGVLCVGRGPGLPRHGAQLPLAADEGVEGAAVSAPPRTQCPRKKREGGTSGQLCRRRHALLCRRPRAHRRGGHGVPLAAATRGRAVVSGHGAGAAAGGPLTV